MEYYKLLNLIREPFSNTPDPGLFFRSTGHARCLQELEIAIRLGRGLCVVAGQVGTGKTTICRHLIRSMADERFLEIHMVLDPSFENGAEMLAMLNAMFNGQEQAARCATTANHKEMIKNYLFRRGMDEQKTIILVVDEGQKLSSAGVEILRELLNYETNDQKLLQIIIFAQNEIDQILARHPNFADRVGLFHRLLPLSRKDTALLIHYRLEMSGNNDPQKPRVHFTRRALSLIHSLTGGYPRKIINLCHNILLALIIFGAFKVTPAIVRRASNHLPALNRSSGTGFRRLRWALGGAASIFMLVWLLMPGLWEPQGPVRHLILHGKTKLAAVPRMKVGEFVAPVKAEIAPENGRASGRAINAEKANGAVSEDPAPMAGAAAPPPPSETLPGKLAHLSISGSFPAADDTSVADSAKLPSSLGFVRVNSYETLSAMIQRVYGFYTSDLVHRVVQSNRGIQNMNLIRSGQRIHFPVINPRPAPEGKKYWIEVGRFSLLDEAYQVVFAKNEIVLRILGVWDRQNGAQYLIVVDCPFAEKADAEKGLQMLPVALASKARVSGLDGQVVISGLSLEG